MKNNMKEIITIDGPVGVGKSTVAKIISEKLSYTYLDTGAMYRALTLKIIRKKIPLENLQEIIKITYETNIDFNDNKVILDGEDVSNLIRTKEVEESVSLISSIPEVRKYIVQIQRKISEKGKVVMDGRDCGTVIAPDAKYKFYLDASLVERAKRRLLDKKYSDQNLSLEEVIKMIEERDKIDKTRKDSPLTVPPGAIVINTDGLSIEQVVEKMLSYIK